MKSALKEHLALHYFTFFIHQDDVMLNDGQTLGNCGFTNQTARPQAPATVGLAFRLSGEYYTLYSTISCYFNIQ